MLPLPEFLHRLLRRRRKRDTTSPFVFPGRTPERPLGDIRYHMDLIATNSGIDIDLHDLRRTFETSADALDLPYYAMKKLLNHSTKGDVTSGYIINDVKRLKEPMDRISAYLLEKCCISMDCELIDGDPQPKKVVDIRDKRTTKTKRR